MLPRRSSNWMQGVACIFAGLMFIGAIALLWVGLRDVWRASASRRWPVAAGVVAPSEAVVSKSSDGNSTVSANIVVAYNVKGRDYRTDRMRFGNLLGSSDVTVAQLWRMRFPAGRGVSVRYDPARPELAVVQPGFTMDALWLPASAFVIALMSIMFVVLFASAERSSSGIALGVGIFATIFAMLGTAGLVYGLMNLYRAHASSSWPVARAEIVYGEVTSTTTRNKDDDGSTYTTTTHSPAIVYRYDVAGETYFSNQRRFGQLAGADEEWARQIADRYPKGTKMDVRYDPSNPESAVMEPGITSEAYWIPGVGLVALMFAVAVFVIIVPSVARDF